MVKVKNYKLNKHQKNKDITRKNTTRKNTTRKNKKVYDKSNTSNNQLSENDDNDDNDERGNDDTLFIPLSKFVKETLYHSDNKIRKSDKIKTTKETREEFVKDLLKPFAPAAIKPEDDFYDYINYTWLSNVELKEKNKYITQIDDFRLVQDKVYEELNVIVKDFINKNNSDFSKNMSNFYHSAVNLNSIESSRKFIKNIVNKIDEIRLNKNNLWKLLAFINKNELISSVSPFKFSVREDRKEPNIARCYLEKTNFAILDMNVYFNDGKDTAYKNQLIKLFKKSIQVEFQHILGNGYKSAPNDVFEIEQELASNFDCPNTQHESPYGYNRVTPKEAMDIYSFNWDEFSKDMGFSYTPPFFITSSLQYLKCTTKLMIDKWDSKKWRNYWIWIFIRFTARFTKVWDDDYFSFQGRVVEGLSFKMPSESIAMIYMSLPYNHFLSIKYVEKFHDDRTKKYVRIMCEELKLIFTRIIQNNTWLSPSTKKYALLKLAYLKFVIGSYSNILNDPNIEYEKDNLINNFLKIIEWRHNFFIHREGEIINFKGEQQLSFPDVDWSHYPPKLNGTQPYIVNAFYTPTKNNIFIPLGYMQKPFVDLEADIENNLAHLGFTISHEMSHSLDDTGSYYDYNGALYDWWTKEDRAKFKKLQEDVIKQYESAAKRDGINFDAKISTGENLADISGLAVVMEYLRDYIIHKQYLSPIQMLSIKKFLTYYAFQMRSKLASKKALNSQVKTNPHPLVKYRTNVPLTRSVEFRNIFNVKKGDGMYYDDINTIW